MGNSSGENRNITTLIKDFCDNILTYAEFIDPINGERYIKNLKDEEKRLLLEVSNDEKIEDIRSIVINCIQNYVTSYSGISSIYTPFAFDNSHNFQDYRKKFIENYKQENNSTMPKAFDYAFDCIKDASENFRFFESFFVSRKYEISIEIDQNLKNSVGEKVNNELQNQIEAAIIKATTQAELAAQTAKESAEKAVKIAVNDKMADINKNVSETSVTILGIFAAIVLTVVAGLFYSSSVISNIVCADTFELISIGSLVGVVCVDLISSLFYFIGKIKELLLSPNFKKFIIALNIVFLIFVATFGILSFMFEEKNSLNSNACVSETTMFEEPYETLNTCQ